MRKKARTRRAAGTALPSVAVIGAGNWGTSLVHALQRAGFPLSEVVVPRSRSSQEIPTEFSVTTLSRAALDASILWLCVPDSAIAEVTRRVVARVAKRPEQLSGQIVVHSSGVLNTSVLSPAARAGASVATVHPVMTFPTRTPVELTGVPFGVEADASVRHRLDAIVHRIGGVPFALDSSAKALYHVVGMFASPLLVSLLAAAHETAELAGLSSLQAKRVIEPIARASLANFFSKGKANSFSGPIARGDLASIHLHLRALSPHPILADLYRSLVVCALETLPARKAKEIRRVLQGYGPGEVRRNAASAAAKVKNVRDAPAVLFGPVRNYGGRAQSKRADSSPMGKIKG
jgi:predicted short-subunit dehydrogenase-like oxidoreductase (DUF2520 family)